MAYTAGGHQGGEWAGCCGEWDGAGWGTSDNLGPGWGHEGEDRDEDVEGVHFGELVVGSSSLVY